MKTPTVEEQKAAWFGWHRNDPRRGSLTFKESEKMLAFWDVPLGAVEAIFGSWAVTKDGVECLVTPYLIERRRIPETNWYHHVSEKVWMEGYEEDLFQALQYEDARRKQFKYTRKSYFSGVLKAYQHIYQAERDGLLVIEGYESGVSPFAYPLWMDRCHSHHAPSVAVYNDAGGYRVHCDCVAYPDHEDGTTWFKWTAEEQTEIQSWLRYRGQDIGVFASNLFTNDGSTELWIPGPFEYARQLGLRFLKLIKSKRPPRPPNQSRILGTQIDTANTENPMIKLFKDGKALALQTDASDEAQFTRDFSTALQDYITSPKFEGQHEVETYLKSHVEVCCKMRGYKAAVKEQRLLTVGDINPSSETLVNVTEYGQPQEVAPQELKAVA